MKVNKSVIHLTLGAILLALSIRAEAQQPKKVPRIGYLDNSTAAGSAELMEVFRKEMIQLGWVEGKNITVDYRFGEGKGSDRLAELAAEMVRGKPDVIVVPGDERGVSSEKSN